ncbi:MAG TPA: DUF3098 domain-containing protein [Bacteroidota bacterium]|nr:DUF3098 domain-containing protein [Bacteroidota bacterium]
MAKVLKGKQKRAKMDDVFPFERENFIIMGIGLVFIIVGYIALSGNTVEGFSQLTLAPLLLVLGYCVIIPIGIMYRKKEKPQSEVQTHQQV